MNNPSGAKLIEELLESPYIFFNQGKSYQLLQEYFNGFSLETLRPLFYNDDLFVKRVAIWITSELGYNGTILIDDAITLLKEDDRYIKYYALEVIAICSIDKNVQKFIKVVQFLECEDVVLCDLAASLISNANHFQLEKCAEYFGEKEFYNKFHYEGLSKLLKSHTVTQKQLELMLCSDNPLTRRYGSIILKSQKGVLCRLQ